MVQRGWIHPFSPARCISVPDSFSVSMHREGGKRSYEIISDPVDLPVGHNSNTDLLVKGVWRGFFGFFRILMYARVCVYVRILPNVLS